MSEYDHLDVSHTKGNASDTVKRKNEKVFRVHALGLGSTTPPFASGIGSRIRIMHVDVNPHKEASKRREARAVAELIIDKPMLNGFGFLHGGCIAYLVDICTAMPYATLAAYDEENDAGPMRSESAWSVITVSQSLNIAYHAPAKEGALLKIISYSVAGGKRSRTVRCEIWDSTNNRLVASGVHLVMSPSAPKVEAKL